MKAIGDLDNDDLRKNFHWPSDSDQVWRHFSDYSLVKIAAFCIKSSGSKDIADICTLNLQIDKKGKVVEDMLVEEGSYRAQGAETLVRFE